MVPVQILRLFQVNPNHPKVLEWMQRNPEGAFPELLPEPSWEQFNLAMLQDADFNQVYAAANAINPLLCSGLPTAYAQVASGNLINFAAVYQGICQLGQATPAQRSQWRALAIAANLPSEFVDLI